MTTNELMNFDWVYCDGEPIQVIIYGESICTPAGGERKAYRLEPIPLTPEILEKNGFKKGMREYTLIHFEKNELPISLNPLAGGGFEWTDSNCVVITEISYVHELQRVLKICGIDKNITL